MREFVLIVVAGLVSAALGAGFGWSVGRFAPEFIELLAGWRTVESPAPVATALGAIVGLFIGAAAMAFGLWLSVLRGRQENSRRSHSA